MSDDGQLKFLFPTEKAPALVGGYLLFAGDRYYPAGGWRDFQSRWQSQTEAEVAGEELLGQRFQTVNETLTFEWWHVVDAATFDLVASSESAT